MKVRIWIALFVLYVVWGSTYLAIRYAVETIPPFLMASTRFLIAGAILYAWRRLAGDKRPTRLEWRAAAIVGLFLLVGGNGGVVWAGKRVASGVSSLLVGSVPLWMVLVDSIWPGGKRPSWLVLAGVLVGFVGIGVLIGPGTLLNSAQRIDPYGAVSLLLGSLFWAIGSIYSRQADLPESALMGTGIEMLAGGAGLLALGTLSGEWTGFDLAAVTPRSLYGLGYLVVFGSLIGFVAYTWLLRNVPTPLVSTYAYVNPLVAILIGSLLANEPLTLNILLAALVILSAVALINLVRQPAPAVALPSSGDD